MYKFSKFMEWAYLAIGVVFTVEAVTNLTTADGDQNKAIVSGLMAALAIFMFFFKRRFRNKQTQE
ncbi:hypothetical protein N9901_00120 [Flavobacteriaceae bacterium]|nr:hypothetical protein [Flavobacteriaceae bacterium]